MRLEYRSAYAAYGLGEAALDRLARFGDLLRASPTNVTAITSPSDIERHHFLDSLSLLRLDTVRTALSVVDVGSGGGLPAVVLAIALPASRIAAVEATGKKARFIEAAAADLSLGNLEVLTGRAEDIGRGTRRESFDVAVVRAVSSLPVVAELALPLVKVGGSLVAMTGTVSDEERTEAASALAILGGDHFEDVQVEPFAGAENRFLRVARKTSSTPSEFPRRAGTPAKRPLGRRKEHRA